MPVLERLAAEIERACAGPASSDFPEVARQVLAKFKLSAREYQEARQRSRGAATGQAGRGAGGGHTIRTGGGDTVMGDGFRVEVLSRSSVPTWPIHSHEFSGAFRVLGGTSLHWTYTFTTRSTEHRCRFGRLTQVRAELLSRDATRLVKAGDDFVHAMFHLERVLLLVVKKNEAERKRHKYGYYPPGFAVPDSNPTAAFQRIVTRLKEQPRDAFPPAFAAEAHWDLDVLFRILMALVPTFRATRRLDQLREVGYRALQRYRRQAREAFQTMLDLEADQHALLGGRRSAESARRLFFALLLTQQTKKAILTPLIDYMEPYRSMASWLRTLAERRVLTKIPADARTETLLTLWLRHGHLAAVAAMSGRSSGTLVHAARKKVMDERILRPLVR